MARSPAPHPARLTQQLSAPTALARHSSEAALSLARGPGQVNAFKPRRRGRPLGSGNLSNPWKISEGNQLRRTGTLLSRTPSHRSPSAAGAATASARVTVRCQHRKTAPTASAEHSA